MSFILWQGSTACLTSNDYFLSNCFARLIAEHIRLRYFSLPNWSTPIFEFVSMQSDTSFLLTSASVHKSMMWGTMRYKGQWQHSTSDAKGLSGTLLCSTPPIFFKKTIATFEFEVLALLGNNWGLSRNLYDGRGHATIAGLHPLSHFSALPGCHWYFVWFERLSFSLLVLWQSTHRSCASMISSSIFVLLKGVGLPMLLIRDWSIWDWRWSSDVSPFV